MAEDFLLGTVVPCPSCGTSLAIPAAAPIGPAARYTKSAAVPPAAGQPLQSTDLPLFDRMGADPRQRQKVIALAVVMGACVLWLLFAAPNLWQLAWGRPLANFEKTAAGAVIFWVGVLAACGGILEWSFFMDSYKMRNLRDWFGYEGARWFYVGVGGVISLMGLGLTFTTSGYASLITRRRSPERPVFAVRQEHLAPQVGRPAAPPPPPASANRSAPPAPPVTGGGNKGLAGEKLPGTWRQLEGGLCIKIPAAIEITEDSVKSTGRGKAQQISGHTQIGSQGVNFSVRAVSEPGERPIDDLDLLRHTQNERRKGGEHGEIIVVNGLSVLRTESHPTQPGPLRRRNVTLHKTSYYYLGEGNSQVTVAVYSELPLDDPAQKVLRVYMDTLQRMPEVPFAAPPPGTSSGERLADGWKALEGGFRIQLVPEYAIHEDNVSRGGANVTVHRLTAESAAGVRLEVTVISNSRWKHRNDAQAAVDRARGSGFARGREHAVVDLGGLVMEKITISDPAGKRRDTKVEYKYLEGQHQITMQVWAELPLDDPSFQAAIRSVESIAQSEAE